MAIGTWDPEHERPSLTPPVLTRLIGLVADLEAPALGLGDLEVRRLAAVMHLPASVWREAAERLTDEDLVALVKALTVAEQRLPGWASGADSPVIPLAAVLKARDAYPDDLTRWIRARSDNRFLPYGSLMDRL